MHLGRATGLQAAFLMFAVMLLAVPVSRFIVEAAAIEPPWLGFVEKGSHFALALLVIFAFPVLRRFALAELSKAVPRSMRIEVLGVSVAKLALPFAAAAVLAFWAWMTEGPAGLERIYSDADKQERLAYSPGGLTRLFLAVAVAPVVEELVCRGFIYRAFERQWGWFASMTLTSAVFGLYHPHFWSAFVASIIYVCLLRRTGTLWAPIFAHMLFNAMLWWPLLGQHVFPHRAALELSEWTFHAACVLFLAMTLPVYVWMSRDRHTAPPTVVLEPNGALQK